LDLPLTLRDGAVLCKLVNVVKPGSIARVHVSVGDFNAASLKVRKNVESFLEACRVMQLPSVHSVTALDILQAKGTMTLVDLVHELLGQVDV
jgi:hypothetical protein